MTTTLDANLPEAYQLDERALTEIYQALSPPLYSYAYRLLGNARANIARRISIVSRTTRSPIATDAATRFRLTTPTGTVVITLADLQVGQNVSAQGKLADGTWTADRITAGAKIVHP